MKNDLASAWTSQAIIAVIFKCRTELLSNFTSFLRVFGDAACVKVESFKACWENAGLTFGP